MPVIILTIGTYSVYYTNQCKKSGILRPSALIYGFSKYLIDLRIKGKVLRAV